VLGVHIFFNVSTGGDLGSMHPSPNILRSTVIGREAKYELTKTGLNEEFFVLKSGSLVKKRD